MQAQHCLLAGWDPLAEETHLIHWRLGRVSCTFKVSVRHGWAAFRAFLASEAARFLVFICSKGKREYVELLLHVLDPGHALIPRDTWGPAGGRVNSTFPDSLAAAAKKTALTALGCAPVTSPRVRVPTQLAAPLICIDDSREVRRLELVEPAPYRGSLPACLPALPLGRSCVFKSTARRELLSPRSPPRPLDRSCHACRSALTTQTTPCVSPRQAYSEDYQSSVLYVPEYRPSDLAAADCGNVLHQVSARLLTFWEATAGPAGTGAWQAAQSFALALMGAMQRSPMESPDALVYLQRRSAAQGLALWEQITVQSVFGAEVRAPCLLPLQCIGTKTGRSPEADPAV